jgi:hypothetical protein
MSSSYSTELQAAVTAASRGVTPYNDGGCRYIMSMALVSIARSLEDLRDHFCGTSETVELAAKIFPIRKTEE